MRTRRRLGRQHKPEGKLPEFQVFKDHPQVLLSCRGFPCSFQSTQGRKLTLKFGLRTYTEQESIQTLLLGLPVWQRQQ